MATYYVRKSGSDSNDGLSAGAAFLTVAKFLHSTGVAANGDTCYVGAGTYFNEEISSSQSFTTTVNLIGDVTGQYTGDAGLVRVTNRHADSSADDTAPVLTCSQHVSVRNIVFEGSGVNVPQSVLVDGTNGGHEVTFTNCAFLGAEAEVVAAAAGGYGPTLFENCIFAMATSDPGYSAGIWVRSLLESSQNQLNVKFKNCVFFGVGIGIGMYISGGSGSYAANGVEVYNCYFDCGDYAYNMDTSHAAFNSTYPSKIYNSVLNSNNVGILAAASGKITEDYNIINATTPRTNVSAGSNSLSGFNRHIGTDLGVSELILKRHGALHFYEPYDLTSRLIGVGAQGGGPTVDMRGGPRPSGGENLTYSAGALECGDPGEREASTVRSGSTALLLHGPGYHDISIPVNAEATSVTIYGRYDSSHAATNKPQIKVLNGAHIGVSDATATMTAAADTWEALTLSFTPTAKGVVTIRMISRSAAATGKAFFDS